ncbi:HlyD family type I secretion periplasmic adaptor subunit [Pelagibius litoralis]|uniref:Membrane fusion protein (MFP) family protein n=1 Tax=Pelagibius litoralis TaxID=374515 RepID=A0A967F360_9PROT|nr:HlyD family type I secretion periplasmic adaptor subunit [Pelagibius litoralis]NIA72021.1 HlyD family type I secretion periplasmic adaptor subunit [Pelagibius litoralis]
MSTQGVFDRDDLDYMPDVHAATRQRGRRFAYILTLMSVAFFAVMGIWAHNAVLDEVTRGEGTIIPSSKTQVIQNLEGGILSEILVREGDIVEAGDVLARIENTIATANLEDAQSQYLSLQATEARLVAELDEKEEITFPETVLDQAPIVASDQKRFFNARKRQLAAQVSVLESQATQRKQEVAEMGSRRRQLEQSLRLAREELAITAPLVKKGVMPRIDLIRIDRQVADLEGEIRTIRTAIPRLQAAQKEAEQRIEEMVLTTKTEASDELNGIRAEIKSISQSLFAGQDRVTRTSVQSRVRGTVKNLKRTTVGGVIQPGEDIMEIVPLDDTLLVEAQVRPADIAFLRPGQNAIIKVSAYDFSVYGGLSAALERISADTIKDEEGESFYRVYLRTEDSQLLRNGEVLPIIPGMTVTAEILTGEKSVLDYLLKPILKAKGSALRER